MVNRQWLFTVISNAGMVSKHSRKSRWLRETPGLPRFVSSRSLQNF